MATGRNGIWHKPQSLLSSGNRSTQPLLLWDVRRTWVCRLELVDDLSRLGR